MAKGTHRATAHHSAVAGVQALSITSDRVFPRHDHDQFGFGVMTHGGHRSWSAIGTVEAVAGDVLMVNPGEIHDGAPLGDGPRSWRMLFVEPAMVARTAADEIAGTPEIALPAVRDRPLAARIVRLLGLVTGATPDGLALEETMTACVMRVLRRHRTPTPAADRAVPTIAPARDRLDDAPELPTSLAELAALTGLSRYQFLRAFSRQVGTTPYAYLMQRRVGHARRLLATGVPPSEAAAATGFADQSHLTRAFVRQYGVTPGAFRTAARP